MNQGHKIICNTRIGLRAWSAPRLRLQRFFLRGGRVRVVGHHREGTAFRTITTGSRAKLQPSSSDDLYRRFSRVKRRGDEPSRNPLPIPLPRHPDTGLPKGAADEVQNAQFGAKAVEPHTTQAGFLFFDVQDVRQPLAGSHLYVTGVRDARGNELMFFDIALDNYTGAPVK